MTDRNGDNAGIWNNSLKTLKMHRRINGQIMSITVQYLPCFCYNNTENIRATDILSLEANCASGRTVKVYGNKTENIKQWVKTNHL